MNTTLLQVEWEACVLEPGRDPALEALARRAYGSLPPHLPYLVHCPWVARASVTLNPEQGLLVSLDFGLADLVSMVVSQDNSCRYCFAISHLLLRVQGMSDARIAELQARLAQGAGDPRTAAAVAFARRLSRSQPLVGTEDQRRLREAGFTEGELREMAYVVAYVSWINRVATIVAVSPFRLERLPDRWLFGLLRPLMARVMGGHRRRGAPAAVATPAPADGLHSDVLDAYAGSPIAAALAGALDELWASPVLTRRCKALLFAVVATGLDCPRSTQDARAVLRAEGLADEAIDRALRHLQAPELDAVENLLLPFARETIWYQPAPLQRRARELCGRLTPAQFVEAVGVASLANALCRLAPALPGGPR
jgi:AhpD family alkylhydroperoxidase